MRPPLVISSAPQQGAHVDPSYPEELALALGLQKARAIDPSAFDAAVGKAQALSARITRSRSLADEPAHIFLPNVRSNPGETSL